MAPFPSPRFATTLALLILVYLPSRAFPATVIPMDFRQLVDLSGLVFAGTVTSVEGDWTPSHGQIITKVHFESISIAKGNRPNKLTLNLLGGQVGSARMLVPGQPQFVVGKRYVVLSFPDMGSDRNQYLPVVGLWQGIFSVDEHSGMVRNSDGMALVGLEGDNLVMVDESVNPPPAVQSDIAARGAESTDSLPIPHAVRSDRQPVIVLATPGGPPPTSAHRDQPTPSPQRQPIRFSRHPIKILPRSLDPGKRIREGEFLDIVRRLAGP